MRFVFSHAGKPEIIEAMCRWAGPRMGSSFDPERTAGISVICENGAATVLYTDLEPTVDVMMHAAGVGHWLSRTALGVFFGYPFQELGVRRVTALVARKNRKARKMNEKLGFVHEGCRRKALLNGDHQIIYGMLKHECRWLREEHGQVEQRA